jgi:hypothetical protein
MELSQQAYQIPCSANVLLLQVYKALLEKVMGEEMI